MADGYLAIALLEDLLDLGEDWDEDDAIEEERFNRRILRDAVDPFSCSEVAFRRYFRLSRQLARDLCDWLRAGLQRQRRHGLTVERQVLTAVRFFATGSFQGAVGQNLNVCFSQPSVSRAVHRVVQRIEETLFREFVRFPVTPEDKAAAKYKFISAPQPFEGAIGAIDCTHVALRRPKEHEEDHYNHNGYHSLNCQAICDHSSGFYKCVQGLVVPDMMPTYGVLPVRDNMQDNYMNGERHTFLLGDSGYPLEPWLMTPITDAEPGTPEYLYTCAHCKALSVVERAFGILKGCWKCLSKSRVLQYESEAAGHIFNACVILHSLRLQYNIEPEENEIEIPDPDIEADVNQPNLQDLGNVLLEARRIRNALVQRRFT